MEKIPDSPNCWMEIDGIRLPSNRLEWNQEPWQLHYDWTKNGGEVSTARPGTTYQRRSTSFTREGRNLALFPPNLPNKPERRLRQYERDDHSRRRRGKFCDRYTEGGK